MSVLSYFFFFKQKTAYEMRISDWSSDVCSSDLISIFRDSPHCFHVISTLFPRRLPRRLTRRRPRFPSNSGAPSDPRTPPPPYPASPRRLKKPWRGPERQEEEMMVALMPERRAAMSQIGRAHV